MTRSEAPNVGPKLTRPRLRNVVPRERLFRAIDDIDAPVVWISGPPGAGKTTLVASYLESRKLRGIWYQVDNGDCDPATFFYFMGLAASRQARRKHARLPLLPSESSTDISVFARRYFQTLFAQLPQSSTLVLDNLQEAASPTFDLLCREAIGCVPDGLKIVVVSLSDPPPALARLVANRFVELIHDEQLRLTLDESKSVVRAQMPADEHTMIMLHDRSGGWAAGLVLMAEHLRRAGSYQDAPLANSQEAVFDYFAGEIFARATPENQRVLMLTAALPRVPAKLVDAVSGTPGSERLLEYLYRHHLFTDRRSSPETVYQYHGLFRAFLRARAGELLSAADRADAAARAAILLEESDNAEDAVALYLEAADWASACRLVVAHARRLYEQGRWRTLMDWIGSMPDSIVDSVPWLAYWVGACQVWVDPPRARQQLEGAFAKFIASSDRAGQILAAGALSRATILDAIWDPLDKWIAALTPLLSGDNTDLSAQTLLTGLSRLLYATFARQPQHPLLEGWAQRVFDTLSADVDCNEAVLAAYSLMAYYNWVGETSKQEGVIRQVQPMLEHPNLSPVTLTYWKWAHSNYVLRIGAPEDALTLINEGLSLAEDNGLTIAGVLRRHRIGHYLSLGDLASADAAIKSLAGAPRVEPYFEMSAWLALLRGDLVLAQSEANVAVQMANDRGRTYYQVLDLLLLAQVAVEAAAYDGATNYLDAYRARINGIAAPVLEYQALLVEAYLALRRFDREACRHFLRKALSIGREQRFHNHWAWFPKMMAQLYAVALEGGIEVDYVRDVIAMRKLLAPTLDIEHWPWPVKIYTLGRFEILKSDQAIRFEGKAQRKPIEFLKILVALGGRDVPADKLIDTMWPEPLEDAGQKSFDITVHRVRKLLGSDEALQVTDRRATLNPQIVWVDVLALEATLTPLTSATSAQPEIEHLEHAAARVLELYRGDFLSGDTPTSWQVPTRNRLSGRFHRFVVRLGEHWEKREQWALAQELYQRAIDLDPLAESFYRRQMVCLQKQGQRAEAVEVFRRCRHTLSVVLGVLPTPETEQVYRQLLAS